jgi:hypothetical protein
MPTIDFHTYDSDTLKNFKPVLARSIQPDWWKKGKVAEVVNGTINKTIRSCPAMQDWLQMGYILVANRDMIIKNGITENDSDSIYFHASDPKKGDLEAYSSQTHPSVQTHDGFEYMGTSEAPIKDAFKMSNPWNVTTPKGYSCFYLDPFLFQNDFFATWQGIIDTDEFNVNKDNSQIIFYPKVDHSFVIKKGTPLCQVIPFQREEWVATYQVKDHKSYVTNLSKYTSETEHLTMAEASRIGMADTLHTAGPYKKAKVWKPKFKFFKEDLSECPFDPKTGKMKPEYETKQHDEQLEIDFGDNTDGS